MDEPESRIGRYTVLERIGSGGFATVYRVRDSHLDREVALKVMRPLLLSDPNFVARFEQEARVVANLDHPNIVPIYDYGDIEDRLCLVMKLLPGGSLADLLQHGPLPWPRVVSLTAQIASALDYAHERGLVHRDIKPENVLLDEQGKAVLADFGLVRALESGRLTTSLSGGVLGTPAYVAPEVWNGEAGTRSTDVYGLACLVYEMITGAQLFDAPTPPATMRLHFHPPHFPEQWPEGTPPGVERVLGQALAHEPGERHPSAGAFAGALAQLADDPLAAPYEALAGAMAGGRWPDAVALAESILERAPAYRDTRALLEEATARRLEAERAAWAAQWQAETAQALEAGDWRRALNAAQRWQEFAPEDVAAKAAMERARQALQPEAQPATAEAGAGEGALPEPETAAGGALPGEMVAAVPLWQRLRSRPAVWGGAALLVVLVVAAVLILTRGLGGAQEPATPDGDLATTLAQLGELATGDGVAAALRVIYEGELAEEAVHTYNLAELGTPLSLVEAIPESELDVFLELYDPGGNYLRRVDEGSAGEPERMIVWPVEGTVEVGGFSAGRYTLQADHGLEPGESVRVTGGELGDGEVREYPFDALEGATVAAVTAAGFDLALELWHDDGALVARDGDEGHEQILTVLPEEDSYAFTVLANDGGDYRLLLYGPPSLVGTVAPGDELIGAFAPDMLFEYGLELAPGATVTLAAAPDNEGDIALVVRDEDGDDLAHANDSGDGGSENVTFTAPDEEDEEVTIQLSELKGLGEGHFTMLIEEGSPGEAGLDFELAHFDSAALGLSFDYPAGFEVEEGNFEPFAVVATANALMLEQLQLYSGEEVTFLDPFVGWWLRDAAEAGDGPLVDMLQESQPFSDLSETGEVLQEPEATTIGGMEAATAIVAGDAPDGTSIAAILTMIRHEGRLLLVAAFVPTDQMEQHEPALRAIVESIELRPAPEQVGRGGIAVGDSAGDEVGAGAYHTWHLAGSAGQPVRIVVEPGEEFDVMVDVRGENGRSILDGGQVDSDGAGSAETVELTFPADGEYLIYILGYGGSTGPYTLSVEESDD